MNVFKSSFRRMLAPFAILVLAGATVSAGTALAFTCSSNADCSDRANQCDPGAKPCNDGICSPNDPDADNIGCVLIPNNFKCDDGVFCNGTEYCDTNHGCRIPPAPDCNDDVACTADRCDEAQKKCTHTRRNSACSDGLFCNGTEVCTATGCEAGTPPNCNDSVTCTADVCDELLLRCVHTPNNASCSDGNFCDGVEVCDAVQGCKAGPPPNCNDNISCTADSCSEANKACVHNPNNSLCNDGQFCDGVETCSPSQGCVPGTPPNCNDNVTCTADSCDEAHDTCAHSPNNGACSDGEFCNGIEICSPTQGCQPGTGPSCNDNVDCTTDVCVESNDTCSHTPSNAKCSDGLFCDGVEVCSPTQGCQPGTSPNCSDNVDCTTDACVESNDTCSHTPSNAFCSDGLFCDGIEICSPTKGCQPATPPNCNDDVSCTVDVCDEQNDRCSHTADHSLCSNNLFCDGIESCNPLNGCHEGTPPNCADNVDCTQDYCDEVTHGCGHLTHDERCTDGLFCNGAEVCDALTGCHPGTPVVCSDGITCTTDTCSETADMCVHVGDNTSCGNCVLEAACGEECDPCDHEICDNFIDDDGDGLIDCADPDCEMGVASCDVDCVLRNSCVVLSRDPAVISFPTGGDRSVDRSADGPGRFAFHGKMIPMSDVDPLRDGFVVTLINAEGEIFRAEVKPADIEARSTKRYAYRARDKEAVQRDGGIARLSIRVRTESGVVGYGIRVEAYGDFSRATLPEMTTQAYLGDDVGFVTATWSGEVGHWKLAPKDYDGGLQ